MKRYQIFRSVTWGVIGLALLSIPAFIAVIAGKAEPYLFPPSPFWRYAGLGLIVTGLIGGFLMKGLVEAWHWAAVGRQAGLTPSQTGLPRVTLSQDDDALIGKPILSGTVRGRPVRARVYTRTIRRAGHEETGGSRSTTHTVVEADLDQSQEDGVLIRSADSSLLGSLKEKGFSPTVHDDQFAALADEEDHAKVLTSGRVREALRSMDEFVQLGVGDAEGLVEDAVPQIGETVPGVGGSSVGSMLQSGIEGMLSRAVTAGDAQTVIHRKEGALLDPNELERQVEAVVTTAEVFEEVQAHGTSDFLPEEDELTPSSPSGRDRSESPTVESTPAQSTDVQQKLLMGVLFAATGIGGSWLFLSNTASYGALFGTVPFGAIGIWLIYRTLREVLFG